MADADGLKDTELLLDSIEDDNVDEIFSSSPFVVDSSFNPLVAGAAQRQQGESAAGDDSPIVFEPIGGGFDNNPIRRLSSSADHQKFRSFLFKREKVKNQRSNTLLGIFKKKRNKMGFAESNDNIM